MNLEMMKQLLLEFSEREALTTEEIKAIQQQSQELELRIQKCRAKLATVSQDKQKIDAMRQRYSGLGNGQKRSENLAGVMRPPTPPTISTPPTPPIPPAQRRAETTIPPTEEVEKQRDTFATLPSPPPAAYEAPQAAPPVAPAAAPVPALERLATSTVPPATPGVPAANPNRQLAQFFDDIRPSAVPNTSPPAPSVPQFNSAADILTTFESMSSSTPTLGELPPVPVHQQLILNEPPQPEQQQAQPQQPAKPEEESEEGPDETVKSINDALRGLFR
jgi:hypothetical protein